MQTQTQSHASASRPTWLCASEDGSVEVLPWGDVLVVRWSGPITRQSIRHYNRALALMSVLVGGKLATLHVLGPDVPVPGAEERSALLELFAIQKARLSCLALVAQSPQFWSGTWPSWVLATRLLSAKGSPLEAFAAPDRALRWLATHHRIASGRSVDEVGLAKWLSAQV